MTLKTVEEVRAEFSRKGIAVATWAREHDLYPPAVYDLLNKRTRGTRGDAHKAAVLLGIKAANTQTDGVILNGHCLTREQAMTLRTALSKYEAYLQKDYMGDGEWAYNSSPKCIEHVQEIFSMMGGVCRPRGEQ